MERQKIDGNSKLEYRNPKQAQDPNSQMFKKKRFPSSGFRALDLEFFEGDKERIGCPG